MLFGLVIILGLALTRCRATTYTVGDNSGWDISTDLDSWAQDKRFVVGDILCMFFSSISIYMIIYIHNMHRLLLYMY